MEQIDVFKAKIVRKSVNLDWGFRLEGGAEQGLPLKIHRITPGSPAHTIGISSNDVITEIGDVPTNRLTFQQAHDLIAQYGDTIVLTVERKARGSVPQNPVVSHPHHDQPKSYQTYDMSGGKRPAPQYNQPTQLIYQNAPQPHSSHQPQEKFYQPYDLNGPNMYTKPQVPSQQPQLQYNTSDFPTATSRPFEGTPPRGYVPPAAPQVQQPVAPPPQPASEPYSTPEPYSPTGGYHQRYVPEEEKVGEGVSQSKTFKILQSLMQNDEPYSGVSGLPPPRSLDQERWKEEYAKQHPGARVRVFMPQKYNCPMDLYSAPNVVSSFTQQASGYFDELERQDTEVATAGGVAHSHKFKPDSNAPISENPYRYMSQTAAAVLEEDYVQSKKLYWPEYATLPRSKRTGRKRAEPPSHHQVTYQMQPQPVVQKPVPVRPKPPPQPSVQMMLQQPSVASDFQVPRHVLIPPKPKPSQQITQPVIPPKPLAVVQQPKALVNKPSQEIKAHVQLQTPPSSGITAPREEPPKVEPVNLSKDKTIPEPQAEVHVPKVEETKVQPAKETKVESKAETKDQPKAEEPTTKPTEHAKTAVSAESQEQAKTESKEQPKVEDKTSTEIKEEPKAAPVETKEKTETASGTQNQLNAELPSEIKEQPHAVEPKEQPKIELPAEGQKNQAKSEPSKDMEEPKAEAPLEVSKENQQNSEDEKTVTTEITPVAASEPPKTEEKPAEVANETSVTPEEQATVEISVDENELEEDNAEAEFTFTIQPSDTTTTKERDQEIEQAHPISDTARAVLEESRKESEDSGVSVSSTARAVYDDTAGVSNF